MISAIFCLLVGLASQAGASDSGLDRETLRGVKALYVVVSESPDQG